MGAGGKPSTGEVESGGADPAAFGALGAVPGTAAAGIEPVGIESAIAAKVCETFQPAAPMAGMMAMATIAARMPYSLELAPLVSRPKAQTRTKAFWKRELEPVSIMNAF